MATYPERKHCNQINIMQSLQLESSLKLKDTDKAQRFSSHSGHGTAFIRRLVLPLSEVFKDMLEYTGRGRVPAYISLLSGLEPEVISLIVLSTCLDNLHSEPMNKLTLATRVSQYLVQEINYSTLEEGNPGLIENIQRYTRSHRARRRIDDAAKEGRFNVDPAELIEWTTQDEHTVGVTLLEALVKSGLLEVVKVPPSRADKYQWTLEIISWQKEAYDSMLFYSPAYFPLTEEPQGYDYETNLEHSYGPSFPPVKFRKGTSIKTAKATRKLSNGINIQAADTLSKVPYCVNNQVLNVVKELWYAGHSVGHLPSSQVKLIEPYPVDGTEDDIKEWKSKASRTHIDNAMANGLRMYTHRQLSLIEGFCDKPLYFLWQADSRGRLYPLATTLLNPQGHDLSKGLLKFHSSQAKPLGEHGIDQLYLAISEYAGMDKMSITDRLGWAKSMDDTWYEVATRPMDTLDYWAEADKPFMLLSACLELVDAFTWAEKTNSDVSEYRSSLIRYHDGKCSGVQHWAALLRDERTAKLVGLTEYGVDSTPPDIYTDVLVAVLEYLKAEGSEDAEWWLNTELDRKAVKRPTMTYAYASTKRAWTNHLVEWVKDKGIECSDNSELWTRAFWLSGILDTAINERLHGLAEGMRWIQKCSRTITKAGHKAIEWTTYGGFEVQQSYRKAETNPLYVRSKSLGLSLKLSVKSLTDEVDPKKQATTIAPNFIHSRDSTHLCLVVINCVDMPVTVVHDSFGTTLGQCLDMVDVVKTTFCDMHSPEFSQGTMARLKTDWETKYNVELPDVPSPGSWKSNQVLDSVQAFV